MQFALKGEATQEPYLPECKPAAEFSSSNPIPGLYSKVDEKAYFSCNIPSQSWAKPKRKKQISRKASYTGSAANDLILRPSIYASTYIEIAEQHKLNTKAGLRAYNEIQAEYPGMTILRPSEWGDAHRARELVYENPRTREWVESQGEVELTMIANLPDGPPKAPGTKQVLWRGRMDKDTPFYHSDLKVFHTQDEAAFLNYWVYKFGYDVQCALYSDQYETLTGVTKPWRWVCVSLFMDRAFLTPPAPTHVYHTGRRYYQDMEFSTRA